jgi:hypothetical protein
MDPLAALSVAGTIVQFVDYGTKLLSNARELYRSSVGTLDANNELELVTTDLSALITKLQTSFHADDSDCGAREQPSFEQLCDEAAKVAEELVGRLDTLKSQKEGHKIYHRLQKAVASAWSEKEITQLKKRLLGFREALKTRVLFSTRYVKLTHTPDLNLMKIRENLDAQAIRTSI